jgi:hypothetical protein
MFAGLLTVFQFCNIIWLWMLLTGSGDELCGPLYALFQAVAYHLPTVGPSVLVYWTFPWRSACCSSPLFQCTHSTCPLCSCSFSVPCLLFSFFGGVVVSLPRGLWWFIPGVAVGILHATYLLTCWSAASKKVWSCFWPLVTILGPPQVTLNTLNQFSQMLV